MLVAQVPDHVRDLQSQPNCRLHVAACHIEALKPFPFDFAPAAVEDAQTGKIGAGGAKYKQILLAGVPHPGAFLMFGLDWLFLLCAVVGGTVLICQFVLTLVGLGGDHGVDFAMTCRTILPAMSVMTCMPAVRTARKAPATMRTAITARRGCSR